MKSLENIKFYLSFRSYLRGVLIGLTETEKLARANARRQLGGGVVQQGQAQQQQPQTGVQQLMAPNTASLTGAQLIVRTRELQLRARQAEAAAAGTAGQPQVTAQRPAVQQPVTQQAQLPLRDDTQQKGLNAKIHAMAYQIYLGELRLN